MRGDRERMTKYGKDIALQGELIGPGIQANLYSLRQHQWRIFDVFIIPEFRYATPSGMYTILML